jgi:hypothetical protein
MQRFSGPWVRSSAICQLTLPIPLFADGSGRRQQAAISRESSAIEAHALELCSCDKFNDFTHVPSPMSVPDLVPAMK